MRLAATAGVVGAFLVGGALVANGLREPASAPRSLPVSAAHLPVEAAGLPGGAPPPADLPIDAGDATDDSVPVGKDELPVGSKYVALGSSFGAGPGILPAEADSPAVCARSTQNYANQIANGLGLTLTDVTCSGATTANVLDTPESGVPPQIDAVTSDTRLVTMTIGGNDVNYLGSVTAFSCQDSGATGCAPVDEGAITTGLTTVDDRIAAVIDAVHDRAPDADVVVVAYQTILPPTGGLCDGVPLTDAHLAFERNLRDKLDEATAAAASGHGATLVDVATPSADHNACSADPWIEKYAAPAGRTPYHPNLEGMTAVAGMVTSLYS